MTDELLDIIDENDHAIGQRMRSAIHEFGLWHRGVHIFLFTPERKMLIQKRSADRVHFPSALDCSVSEHVKTGESYFDAALRGLEEEMGVSGIEIKPIVKFKMNYGINDNEISTLYEATVDPEKVIFDPLEIKEIYFYNPAELHELMQDNSTKICGWFVEIMNWYWGNPSELTVLKVY
jgi:16S rRNA (adenine1518-N6/adenine1519-N6)-dimethyltransferase